MVTLPPKQRLPCLSASKAKPVTVPCSTLASYDTQMLSLTLGQMLLSQHVLAKTNISLSKQLTLHYVGGPHPPSWRPGEGAPKELLQSGEREREQSWNRLNLQTNCPSRVYASQCSSGSEPGLQGWVVAMDQKRAKEGNLKLQVCLSLV